MTDSNNQLNTAGMTDSDNQLTINTLVLLDFCTPSTREAWAHCKICCLTILTEMWYVAWESLIGMHWTKHTNISQETGEKNRKILHSRTQKLHYFFHIFQFSYLFLIFYSSFIFQNSRIFNALLLRLQVGLQHRIDTNGRRPSELTYLVVVGSMGRTVYLPVVLWILLLMAEILHQLIGSLSHYLKGFIHPRWCKISAINSMEMVHRNQHQNLKWLPTLSWFFSIFF